MSPILDLKTELEEFIYTNNEIMFFIKKQPCQDNFRLHWYIKTAALSALLPIASLPTEDQEQNDLKTARTTMIKIFHDTLEHYSSFIKHSKNLRLHANILNCYVYSHEYRSIEELKVKLYNHFITILVHVLNLVVFPTIEFIAELIEFISFLTTLIWDGDKTAALAERQKINANTIQLMQALDKHIKINGKRTIKSRINSEKTDVLISIYDDYMKRHVPVFMQNLLLNQARFIGLFYCVYESQNQNLDQGTTREQYLLGSTLREFKNADDDYKFNNQVIPPHLVQEMQASHQQNQFANGCEVLRQELKKFGFVHSFTVEFLIEQFNQDGLLSFSKKLIDYVASNETHCTQSNFIPDANFKWAEENKTVSIISTTTGFILQATIYLRLKNILVQAEEITADNRDTLCTKLEVQYEIIHQNYSFTCHNIFLQVSGPVHNLLEKLILDCSIPKRN